jgi:hypothetical protein
MPGLHLATSVSLLSSIPAPTAVSHARRDQYLPIPSEVKTQGTDPLNGSLGLFLVMCGLVLVFVLAVAVFFWRIHLHRRSRHLVSPQDVEQVGGNLSLPLPTLLYDTNPNDSHTGVKFPPNLRIRSPIKNKLKLLRINSAKETIVQCAQAQTRITSTNCTPMTKNFTALSLPSIVVSECSSTVPNEDVFGPRDIQLPPASTPSRTSPTSVSSISAGTSTESLVRPSSRQPTVKFDPVLKLNGSTNVMHVSFKTGSSSDKKTTKPKRIVRSSSSSGKENIGVIYDMARLDNRGCVFIDARFL